MSMRTLAAILLCLSILLQAMPAAAADDESESAFSIERRRSQFQAEPAHIIVPYPYSLPGIGSGYGILAAAANIMNTNTDVLFAGFTGDVQGVAAGVNAIHLVPRILILDVGGASLSRASIQSYSQRGMSSDKDDYSIVELDEIQFFGPRLTATFLDRRAEVYVGFYSGEFRIKSIRDSDGNLIIESDDPSSSSQQVTILGGRIDYTDDYDDPRKGIRLDTSFWQHPDDDSSASYYTLDFNTSLYVPAGKKNTMVLNYYRSDAYVKHKGETDRDKLQELQGFYCDAILEPAQKQLCNQVLDNTIAANTYGSSTSLGGHNRLRAYPENRFSGAHTEFVGAEFRWNLTDESTPFDIIFMRDIRTSFQLAFFYEIGTVAETDGALWDESRSDYGVGARMVTASGLVYRADIARGQEGSQVSMFFQYPWEM